MSEAESIAKLALKSAVKADVVTHGDRAFLVVPDGHKYHEISQDAPDAHGLIVETPSYVKQSVCLQTVDSLVEYTRRFKGGCTMLFADIAKNAISAVIDYHASAEGCDEAGANHAAHRATMVLPHSVEWKAWNEIDKRLMPQLEFARFIEENAADIKAPIAGELFEAIRDLQAHRKVSFTAAVRTASDNECFAYADETKAGTKNGDIEIPTRFMLGIPVYFGEPATELGAFLRWKLEENQLLLGIALHRDEHVRQAVFKQIVLSVAECTECPAVFGAI